MTKPISKKSLVFMLVLIAVAQTSAGAQDVEIQGAGQITLSVENTVTSPHSYYAISAQSTPAAGYGYGGVFQGGQVGIYGFAGLSGIGERYGGVFQATGGSSKNWGVYGVASGTNAFAGYFNGNVHATGDVTWDSDEKLKTDIKELDNSLDRLMALQPVSFRFRSEDYPELNLPEGNRAGLVAQDVEGVFPEMVHEVPVPDIAAEPWSNNAPETYLAVSYIQLIPVLIRAIQEQQQQIEVLQAEVASLRGL